jgi:hypothetical protein
MAVVVATEGAAAASAVAAALVVAALAAPAGKLAAGGGGGCSTERQPALLRGQLALLLVLLEAFAGLLFEVSRRTSTAPRPESFQPSTAVCPPHFHHPLPCLPRPALPSFPVLQGWHQLYIPAQGGLQQPAQV